MQTATHIQWGVRTDWFDRRENVLDYDDQEDAQNALSLWPEGVAFVVSRTVTSTSWSTGRGAPFPVPGGRVKCGLRTWLPRAQRVHDWTPLGRDVRNCGDRVT